jgi:hypothetical protein
MTIATHVNLDAANRLCNVHVAPETTVRQHSVLRAIRQKFAIIVINLATFRPHAFLHPNNIDGVASQLPTVGSLRRRNSRAEDAANHQYQTPLRNPFLKTLNMEIICSSKFTEN